MHIKGHEVKVDSKEASTIRGIVWLIGGIVAFIFLYFAGVEKAMAAISITGSIAGGLGVALRDKKEEP